MKLQVGSPQKRRRVVILVALVFMGTFVTLGAVSQTPRFAWISSGAGAVLQSPVVVIEPQGNSPLLITSVNLDATDPLSPRLEFEVVNVSDKSVTAFAIRRNVVSTQRQSSGVRLIHMTSLQRLLQPQQSESGISLGDKYTEPIKTITILVDFVEFADGTVWGADTFRSSERLAGQRAGARAAISHMLEVKTKRGLLALLEAVTAGEIDVASPAGRPAEWEDGFRTGAGVIRERLRKAKAKGGLTEVEIELGRPYDALEGGNQ